MTFRVVSSLRMTATRVVELECDSHHPAAVLGRFCSRDPIGYADGFSLGTIRTCTHHPIALTSSAQNNRYTYTGREWDSTMSPYHYRARMYDPALGLNQARMG